MVRRYWEFRRPRVIDSTSGVFEGRRGALQPAADIYRPVTHTIHWSNIYRPSTRLLGVGGGYKRQIGAVAKQSVMVTH